MPQSKISAFSIIIFIISFTWTAASGAPGDEALRPVDLPDMNVPPPIITEPGVTTPGDKPFQNVPGEDPPNPGSTGPASTDVITCPEYDFDSLNKVLFDAYLQLTSDRQAIAKMNEANAKCQSSPVSQRHICVAGQLAIAVHALVKSDS